ncbi:hypothetical protein FSARC_6738 [Fusarium sarcochroum]|uniref:Extracellular membrane protein CFEM domain-containing protein n=1 Tax=Fusarium sarcochroum TaxID=1208366 RepID=A0A8H4TWU9_9HYPO|nr:hypothetical protein FSARC_6738 [Fusarium sarcochroum]
MASRPFSFVPSWLMFYATAVLATNLSSEFASFIPSCAEECFASFLNVNYSPNSCAGDSQLDCLCSRVGITGFTLGEGAMQCISAELSTGYCSIVEASDRVIGNAYAICNGRPDAISPTHRTITATLVLAPSGGVVTFPSVTRTTSSSETSSTTRSLPTTLVIDTSSPPPFPRPSTKTTTRSKTQPTTQPTTRSTAREHSSTDSTEEATSTLEDISITEPPNTRSTTFETSTSSSTSTAETETTTTTEVPGGAGGASKDEDEDGDKDDSDKLSSEQVAGISVGVLAAVGVAVGAIVLARYYRRRKYPQIKTGFLPMRDTWGYKPERPGNGGNGGHRSWMIHQIRPDLDPSTHPPPPPPAYIRRSPKPGSIGLALSPPPSSRGTVHSATSRRISKLLPAKPTLPNLAPIVNREKSLPLLKPDWEETAHHDAAPPSRDENVQLPPPTFAVPAVAASPTRTKPMPVPPKLQIPLSNTSMGVAPGAYNRESNVTEFEEDRTSLSPNTNTQVWRPPPTTPISATTYYVADQYGNWVLGNPKRASLVARGSQDSKGSQEGVPNPPPKDDNASLGGSSQNNVRMLAPPAEIVPAGTQPRPAGPRPQYPSPFFSSQSHPRRNASMRRSMTRPLTRPREDSSSSSATIITTSTESSSSIPSLSLEQQVSLSPVVESPQSVRARQQQQQQQPTIPPRDPRRASQLGNPGDNINTRTAPPSRQIVYSPPGQPSPTLGMMQPPTAYYSVPQSQPQPGPQNNTQPIANPGLQAASPTMRIVEPSPEPDETAEPAVVNPDQIRSSPFYFDPPYPQPLHTRQPSQHRRSASGPQPQSYRPYQRPPSFQPSPRQQQAAWQPVQRLPSRHHQQHQHQQQQQQQNPWRPVQHMPPSYQSFQQQQPLQPYQRPPQHHQPYQQQPQMYQPYQPRPGQQPHPHHPGGYQSFQQHTAQQHHQNYPSNTQYQNYRPPQTMNVPLAHSGSQDSLLAKRLGSDRAADMAIGTDRADASKWDRDTQNKTPPVFPMSPHWKPTLTPTRRGDDLVLNVQ